MHTPPILLLAVLLPTLGMAAQVYQWTDAEGNVHFSQSPPPATAAQRLEVKPPPPASDPGTPDWRKEAEAFEQRRTERKKREAEAARKAAEEKRRAAHCEKARSTLATVTSHGRVRLIRGDDAVVLTEEERQALIRRLEQQIQEFCK